MNNYCYVCSVLGVLFRCVVLLTKHTKHKLIFKFDFFTQISINLGFEVISGWMITNV
jgi:hypothetical protein